MTSCRWWRKTKRIPLLHPTAAAGPFSNCGLSYMRLAYFARCPDCDDCRSVKRSGGGVFLEGWEACFGWLCPQLAYESSGNSPHFQARVPIEKLIVTIAANLLRIHIQDLSHEANKSQEKVEDLIEKVPLCIASNNRNIHPSKSFSCGS